MVEGVSFRRAPATDDWQVAGDALDFGFGDLQQVHHAGGFFGAVRQDDDRFVFQSFDMSHLHALLFSDQTGKGFHTADPFGAEPLRPTKRFAEKEILSPFASHHKER